MSEGKRTIWREVVYLTALFLFGAVYFASRGIQLIQAEEPEHAASGYEEPGAVQEVPEQTKQEAEAGDENSGDRPEGDELAGNGGTDKAEQTSEEESSVKEIL